MASTFEKYLSTAPTRACISCGKIAIVRQSIGKMIFYLCEEHATKEMTLKAARDLRRDK